MKRKLLFVALLMLATFATTAPSRAIQIPPQAAPAPIVIPFELVTRHIVVKVRIDNSRPLSFVFDTGDKVGIVDTRVATELGLKLEGEVHIGGAGSGTLPGSFVKGASWTLHGLEGFSQPLTLAIPLDRLAAKSGHDFDGIIGSDFIKRFVVEVDYQKQVLRLHDRDQFSYSGPGESVPIQLSGQGHPYIEGEVTPVGGKPIKGKFVLDLGSGGSLALLSPFVADNNLLGNGLKTIKAIGVGGAGGQSNGQIGRIASLKIGRFNIANPLTLFSQDKSGAMASRAGIGNIGQQIAGKFKVFLDYNHDRIILEPNSTFAEPIDRAFAGISLTTEGRDYSTVRIADVLENSPASEAGLQKDDVIVKIDDKPAHTLNVTRLGEMFEKPATYKLTIRRGDQTLQVTLAPRKLV